jgi:hypothetical protein
MICMGSSDAVMGIGILLFVGIGLKRMYSPSDGATENWLIYGTMVCLINGGLKVFGGVPYPLLFIIYLAITVIILWRCCGEED